VYEVREKLCLDFSSKFGKFVRSAAFEAVTNAIGLLSAVFEKDIAICVISVVAQRVSVNCQGIKSSFNYHKKKEDVKTNLHDGISSLSLVCSNAYFCGLLSLVGREIFVPAGLVLRFRQV
jgi:hypothetical protein